MPPKDPELISLRKELEDLIAKCQVIIHTNLLNSINVTINLQFIHFAYRYV